MEDARWRGQKGRLEVRYTTVTDPATGTGVWLHRELLAPITGEPHEHTFAGLFPVDGPPVLARGDDVSWEVTTTEEREPLYTFPRWAWRSNLLPAAQIVPIPYALHHGTVSVGGKTLTLVDAPGATGHIYGKGHASTWAWLHADLGGGDVLEIVAAVSKRAVFRHLPILPFVKLRVDGKEWPSGDPLLNAFRFKAAIGIREWSVKGRDLSVTVRQPEERTLPVEYTDTDGSKVVCHNSERADADIVWKGRRWELRGRAHAEVGVR